MGPVVVVSGFGRCGSSLVMQMLAAGGMRCVGEWPDFEDTRTAVYGRVGDWFSELRQRAVKVLDPHRNLLPDHPYAVAIWLDRDPEQQARSIVKFMRAAGARLKSGCVPGLAQSLRADRPLALAAMHRFPLLTLRFEDLVQAPARVAHALNEHAGGGLDLAAMAGVVIQRDPGCFDGLLERQLLEQRRPPAVLVRS